MSSHSKAREHRILTPVLQLDIPFVCNEHQKHVQRESACVLHRAREAALSCRKGDTKPAAKDKQDSVLQELCIGHAGSVVAVRTHSKRHPTLLVE